MLNFIEVIKSDPSYYKQLSAGSLLMTEYNCPIERRYQDVWSEHNYFVYCFQGKKIWHTTNGSFELTEGKCVFVRKGAVIVEQFFDSNFCLLAFFMSDEFICETLRMRTELILSTFEPVPPVIKVCVDTTLLAFFHAILPFFSNKREPSSSLLELKFKELLYMISDNPDNSELLSYFYLLLRQPNEVSLKRVMEDNFRYNLKLEEFARLSNRSLSTFKRDFSKLFSQSPGKWLLERRLQHAKSLLQQTGKHVGDIAFESGFEDVSHFSRTFKELYGATPIEFRSSKY